MDTSNSQQWHQTRHRGYHPCDDPQACDIREKWEVESLAGLFEVLRPIIDRVTRPVRARIHMMRSLFPARETRLLEVHKISDVKRIFVNEEGEWFLSVEVYDINTFTLRELFPYTIFEEISYEDLLSGVLRALDGVIRRRQEFLDGLRERRETVRLKLEERMQQLTANSSVWRG